MITSNSLKERLVYALQQAQNQETTDANNIREIIKETISQAVNESQQDPEQLHALIKESISATLDTFLAQGKDNQEEITACLEGIVDGISASKRQTISQNQAEIQRLQTQVDSEEQELEKQIDSALVEIKNTVTDRSEKVKSAINSAISQIKDSEEVGLLQKRYAQLKAQLAVLQANLSSRYGEEFDEIKRYVDEAKVWYDRAQKDPENFSRKIEGKHQEFENKLGETGTAVARKERQVKQLLRELWKSVKEVFQDHEHKDSQIK